MAAGSKAAPTNEPSPNACFNTIAITIIGRKINFVIFSFSKDNLYPIAQAKKHANSTGNVHKVPFTVDT